MVPETTKGSATRTPTPAPSRRASIGSYLVVLLAVQTLLIAGLVGSAAVHDFSAARHGAERQAAESARVAARAVEKALSDNIGQLQVQAEVPGLDAAFTDPNSCTLTGNT